ncbi:GIY-YIG nuclease family protein [Alistipes sp.]|uniref:GIY-YIG nuclease family protein n=1 Tax=Alistipes sp. TaxID=1872444 RepID=UPI003AEF5788
MENTNTGLVYILTNPSFREDWVKIGKSSRPVDVRSKELDNTAVPLPFEIFATMQTAKFNEVEKLVHKTIDRLTDLRIRQNREFFNVPPQVALDIFKDIARTIDDAIVTVFENNLPTNKADRLPRPSAQCARRGRFKFSMVGINIGEYVTFTPRNISVKVASDDTVEYEGRIYKLSPFVGTFMPEERRNTSGAYQGAKYFSYKGNILEDLRKASEQCENEDNKAPDEIEQ